MYSRAIASTLTFALLAVATPWGSPPPATSKTVTVTTTATATKPASQCNTGPIQCCNSVQKARLAPSLPSYSVYNTSVSRLTALLSLVSSACWVLSFRT
ncbi:hypothetical protein HGRIS_007140 [Hohenbuehelia grisea]|uniref:Hydrophobin n=1 Tax=Hohenbuehelia grisea TaxID=104357 RepID=A0ABR3JBK2_9AGAR